ncbi:MAG: efflux RND transporter periplasmic adaptor subunit [Sphingobacteriales bacterium]
MKKILYLSAVLFLAACSNKPKDKKAELADLKKQEASISSKITALQAELGNQDSTKGADVSAVTIAQGQFTNYVQIQGRIDAQNNVTAYPQAQGVITALYVKAGDHVSKGQTLAQLDNSVLQQNIAQAQAQATLMSTLYQRQKNLWDQKIGTEVQYLQAQTNLQSAQKQVAGLRQQADLYRIVSPISGVVDQMDLKLGQVVAPGSTGIRVVNADLLKVKADVPESYSGSINQGDMVKVVIPDLNDSVTAKVTFAAKVIDPSSRSFGIEIKLPQNKEFRPNMTAVLKIADYSKHNAISVPVKAIQRSSNGDYVFVNNNGYAKQRNITEGNTSDGLTEIKSGLKPGDQIITEGASELEDGNKITILTSGN